LKDGPKGITEREIGMAFGKGGTGDTDGGFRDRRNDMRVERHNRCPSAEGVSV
jgi:hypothetical protein